ncbi:hypothetical protein GIB67_024067 [Kingdonia uniflora]|uniref:Disease resistance RPP13-like protein 1 n=1 Tax=Kingdonia uniflora TaxID=39325 RepID=A0A7J7LV36_9MAGN|nr:hypothetical protein GIB67_024067 [Kingdonia uniflora]
MSEEGCQLRELSNLNNLRGSLAIADIRGGGSKESINLKSKEHIRKLQLEFLKYQRDDDGSAIELFEPHPNLEELVVWYYGGSKFPNWMEFQSSSIMLRRLQISECRNLEILPPWANLESLQCLFLTGLDSMSPMGLFNGLEASSTTVAYPNLKELTIRNMKHWEEWVMEISSEDINVMPLLRDLYILNCPVLKSVPHQILSQSVKILFISDCPELIISWLPPLLEELTLDGDAGSLSRSLPFNDNTSLKEGWIRLLICCAIKVGDGIGIISRIPNFEITVRQGYNEGQLHTKIHKPLYFVRTVDLSCVAIETLPNEVGSLIHLRYLDLSKTKLVELPESVCNLRNLQTLKLTSCEKLPRLPEGLRKLVNLRHLELNYTDALECLPKGIEELRCLQTLSMFVMSEKGCQLRELSNLNNLRGSLAIADIRGGGSKESINLKSKEHIRTLGLQFVKEDYKGERDDSKNLRTFFVWGLFSGLEASSITVAYPNLKELIINGQKHWEEWVMETSSEDINLMPLLQRLDIYECPILKSLPHQILSQLVRILFIVNCPELTISCLPPLLEELIFDGDAGSPFSDNTSLKVMRIQYPPHSTLPQGLS